MFIYDTEEQAVAPILHVFVAEFDTEKLRKYPETQNRNRTEQKPS